MDCVPRPDPDFRVSVGYCDLSTFSPSREIHCGLKIKENIAVRKRAVCFADTV